MKRCGVCNTVLEVVLDLGKQPIANNFITKEQFGSEYFYSSELAFCPNCFAVQMVNHPEVGDVFNENYAFFTSTSEYMKRKYKLLAESIESRLEDNSLVIDIGGNDGTLLSNLKAECAVLNIEPSANVAEICENMGITTLVEFFDSDIADSVLNDYGSADVITTMHTFGHVYTPSNFVEGIKKLLKPKGVWILEESYIGSMLRKIAYDQIYNEHVFYFSIVALNNLLKRYDLGIERIEFPVQHGGSIRYDITHASNISDEAHAMLDTMIKQEGLHSTKSLLKFGDFVRESKRILVKYLTELRDNGQEIVGYGAAAKSTTILNYCDIDSSLISKIYDTTPLKH